MRRKISYVLFALQFSCASITASSTDSLRVNASPKSAVVQMNGNVVGHAGTSVEVPRRGNTLVEISAPGYQTAMCSTKMTASGGYVAADIALCVFLFPIGCISFIDAGGAWNQLESPQCTATLARDTVAED